MTIMKEGLPGARYLEQLLRLAAQTPACRAAFVGGPLVTGDPDPFAEVDLWLLLPGPDALDLTAWLAPLGETAYTGPSGDSFRIVTTDGLTVTIRAAAEASAIPAAGLRTLVDRDGVALPEAAPEAAPADMGQAAARFWLDLYRAAAALGREQPLGAHAGLERCRAHLLDLYRLALAPGKPGAGWEGADQLLGGKVLAGLQDWLVCPLELQSQWRCAHRLATTYESLILPLTERLGLAYPWAMRSLAFRRLEEVKPGRRPADEPGLPTPAPPPPDEPPRPPAGPARFKVKARRSSTP